MSVIAIIPKNYWKLAYTETGNKEEGNNAFGDKAASCYKSERQANVNDH